jgi:hypothetical protein
MIKILFRYFIKSEQVALNKELNLIRLWQTFFKLLSFLYVVPDNIVSGADSQHSQFLIAIGPRY